MIFKVVNNFSTTLASALAEGATTMVMTDGGANFDDASAEVQYKLTLVKVETINNIPTETHREIVNVTNRVSGNELTVVRAREGTTQLATEWPAGTKVVCRLTAEVPNDLGGRVETLEQAPASDLTTLSLGSLDVGTAAAAVEATVPAGKRMFVDSLEVIPLSTEAGGFGLVQSGSPALPNSAQGLRFSPDGTMMAVGHFGSPYLSIVNTTDWTLISPHPSDTLFSTNGVDCVDWSPNGTWLACGQSDTGNLVVLNTADWTQVTVTETIPEPVVRVAFSPDNAYLALAFADATTGLMVLDTSTWTAVTLTATVADFAYDVKFSHDGTKLAVAHEDVAGDYISVIDTGTWDDVAGGPAITDATSSRAVAWAPDDSLLLVARSASANDRLLAFNTSTWAEVAVPSTYIADGITALDYIDATQFVAVDGGNNVWIVNTSDYSQAFTAVAGSFSGEDIHVDDVNGYIGVAVGGSDFVYVYGDLPFSVDLNLGDDVGTPAVMGNFNVGQFTLNTRVSLAVDYALPVEKVRAEVAAAHGSSANAVLVARGYMVDWPLV